MGNYREIIGGGVYITDEIEFGYCQSIVLPILSATVTVTLVFHNSTQRTIQFRVQPVTCEAVPNCLLIRCLSRQFKGRASTVSKTQSNECAQL